GAVAPAAVAARVKAGTSHAGTVDTGMETSLDGSGTAIVSSLLPSRHFAKPAARCVRNPTPVSRAHDHR
ncbi:hypothetical protein, partial [uncultured Demequina sp.]|uniref:hypothetical protein n=1 Tax=uncultured Demequina sp. TaxID=693499 RepID=UPI0025E7476E